ncbi:DUF1292 domain-containing protein [Brevibacillus laterosporus]|uniref:DUF1292 domain-containing protein n=2 Tax=Brevibacillus TaxID=55080 RepID=A0A0F7EJD0_BRELA|nr:MULTISPECIES: DUF1292 domain-containing protein [Brevibacillus]AKF96254.1 hypothetical protein EX87_22245 [Brevibacillus laterosporus]MCR8985113.1 DUF1292 domain-containing protein [Brevibacillus laterosporus]MCZ0830842.1 DUF1292 domain-containing protein [Brevibacillus halotolerans]OAJ72473.1 hypothetical protein AYJ08_18425 [Brevibacillus sp. SKDU10]GIN99777.1 hypothetical protein J5TS2_04460 [Brevibacillus halotolerans]
MENEKDLALGDIITLDDENGEEMGDFEVIAMFELNNKQFVALTEATEEDEIDEEGEIDIYVFGIEDGELVPLLEEEEEAAHAKLHETMEGIELIDRTHE